MDTRDDLDADLDAVPAPDAMEVDGTVDPRMRDRWISARRAEGRKRLRIFVGCVIGLSLLGIGYVVANSSLLGVDQVTVRGARGVPVVTVTDAARIEPGEPLLFLDTDAVARRIEAIPEIGTARVDTELPNTVTVTVTERRPLGWVQADPAGPIAVVDGTGRVLRTVTGAPVLTQVVGAGVPVEPGRRTAPRAMAALAALPRSLQLRAETLEIVNGDASIRLRGSPPEATRIRLGTLEAAAEKGRVAAAILEDLRNRGVRVESVDVSVPNAPVTR